MSKFDRRKWLQAASAGTAAALSGPLSFLHTKKLVADDDDDDDDDRRGGRNRPDLCGTRGPSPYGPLSPAIDEATGLPLISLPRGFRYTTFSWTGDTMTDGNIVQEDHDGMAVVNAVLSRFDDDDDDDDSDDDDDDRRGRRRRRRRNEIVLIRNHEVRSDDPISATNNYDDTQGGGTTVLRWRNGELVDSRVSVSGTRNNCAGGPTPWGTWITCEENFDTVGDIPHGYCFESLPFRNDSQRDAWGVPTPLTDMGRFVHEAVAVDPETGCVFETEDESGRSVLIDALLPEGDPALIRRRGNSGFYKFVPNNPLGGPGSLEEGGALFMLQAIDEDGNVVQDLRDPKCFAEYDVNWIEIEQPNAEPPVEIDPDSGDEEQNISGPYFEGYTKGGARFQRLEGCWWDPKHDVVVFVDTEGGPIGSAPGEDEEAEGAVWVYDPEDEKLYNVFVSQGAFAPEAYGADNPDNCTVSPRGGVLLCEDGGRDDGDGLSLLGLRGDGRTFEFARNIINITPDDIDALVAAGRDPELAAAWAEVGDFSGQEWAGATFDSTGRWLFVNIQTPGITFAITGPWRRGPF